MLLFLALMWPLGEWFSPPTTTQAQSGTARSCIYDHTSLHSTPGTCRPKAIAYPPSIRGRVRRAIYDSALTFGVPYHLLLKIARCESGLNPRARDGNHFGLFQFLPDTFRAGSSTMRSMTGIVAHTYWNPLDSAYVAGFLFAVGKADRWACLPASYQPPPSANGE